MLNDEAFPCYLSPHAGSWELLVKRLLGLHRQMVFRAGTADSAGRQPGGGIFKNAALKVLRQRGRLMSSGDITK